MEYTHIYDDNLGDINHVSEPVLEYVRTPKTDEPIQTLPRDILIDAAEYALKMKSQGRCIPNTEVAATVNARFGWI